MAKTKPSSVLSEIDDLFAAAPAGDETEAVNNQSEETAEEPELTATAQPMGDDVLSEIDGMFSAAQAPEETAAPVASEPNVGQKILQGAVNFLEPTGLPGAVRQAGDLWNSAVAVPGEVGKDPLGAAVAAGGGLLSGSADAVDIITNLLAESQKNPLVQATAPTNPLFDQMGKIAQQAQALNGGQPLNLKGALASQPGMQALQKQSPNTMQLASGIPMAAATIAGGGEGLAARIGMGAMNNFGQALASGLNQQVQAGQGMNPLAAAQQALPAAYLGGGLAGVTRNPFNRKPAPAPEPAMKVTRGTGNQLPVHQPWAPTLEQIQQAKAARAAAPEPSPLRYPHYLDLKTEGTARPKQPYLDLSQAPPGPKFTKVPPKGIPFPKYLDLESSPKSAPPAPRKYPNIDWEKPAPEPSGNPPLRDFVKRIGKGGDLAHEPGKAGFKRARGKDGQGRNKAELVDAQGNPVVDSSGKPVSYSWNALGDAVRPKAIPEKLMSEYRKIQEKPEAPEPPKAPEPEPPKETSPPPEPEIKNEPAPKEEPKAPSLEDVQAVVSEAVKKLEGKIEGLNKNIDKLERGDVKEPLKKNKVTGEMEGTEVRAERARNYVASEKAHIEAIEKALETYKSEYSKGSAHDYGKSALQGILDQIKQAGVEIKNRFASEESGQGQAGAPFEVLEAGLKGVGAGIKLLIGTAEKLKLGGDALAQHYSGFAGKVDRAVNQIYSHITTEEGRAKIAERVKEAMGLANDFDIIDKYDKFGLGLDMSRYRGALESLMQDAHLPETVAEREAYAKASRMTAEEIATDAELAKTLSPEKHAWLAATKQVTDGIAESVRTRYNTEGINSSYKKFLKNYYEDMTGKTIEHGDPIAETPFTKGARFLKNAMYDNTIKGNWTIHSIHVADAVVHGGAYLGKHFWTGAHKAYANPKVKNYVRGYKASGLMKSARYGDSPTVIDKVVGGAVDKMIAKYPQLNAALKLGKAMEGGWLEGEKMHILRAGILERVAVDMKIKGGAEALINRMESGKLTASDMIEINSRIASNMNDIIGYNPTGILNRNTFQRNMGSVGKALQPFVGMRSVQSRLLYDFYAKAATSGKIADLKQAATMHGLLLATGGASTLGKVGKMAIKASLGAAALNEAEKYLDKFAVLPVKLTHLTPDNIPYLFTTFDGMSRMAADIGAVVENPKLLDPSNLKKQGVRALGNVVGGSIREMPSISQAYKFGEEMKNAQKGYKKVQVFDDIAVGGGKRSGEALVGKYDMMDALTSFMSPRDIAKTHHAVETVIHRDRALDDIQYKYGPAARAEAREALKYKKDGQELYLPDEKINWNKFAAWAKENFDSEEWRTYEKSAEAAKEVKERDKANAEAEALDE